jgi:peptidase E
MEAGNPLLDEFVLRLTGRARPSVCFLPQASGDADHYIVRFYRAFGADRCVPSHLSLFRRLRSPREPRRHLLSQDLIYVGGGSIRSLLGVWRAHGIDRILREAWEAGAVLCGQSAGAMCWFEWGISRSSGTARPVQGLGFIPGSLSVHYHRDPDRRRVFREAVALVIPPGYGVDDGAGLLFRDVELAEAVSARAGAGAWRVESAGGGAWRETALPARQLPDPRPAIDEQDAAVSELRRTVASRAGGRGTPR